MNPLREIGPKVLHFLERNGYDPDLFILIIGILLLVLTIRSLKRWKRYLYWEKWMVTSELLGSIAVVITGVILVIRKLWN